MELKKTISKIFSEKIHLPFWEIFFILFIITLNLALKSFHISDETIYTDEANSIFYAQQPLKNIITYFQYDQNPPAYFIVLHYWIQLTGVSDVSLKLLSVIFSTFCGLLVYFFSKKILNQRAAVFASLLFTFSNAQLYYARECRNLDEREEIGLCVGYAARRAMGRDVRENVFIHCPTNGKCCK